MKLDSAIAKIQHYVPQFVLKHFCPDKKPQIYAFDKEKEKVIRTNIKNVASESGFYNFDTGDEQHSIEPMLTMLETEASHVIKKIIKEKSLAEVSPEERFVLSTFIAVQFLRTKNVRNNIELMNKAMEEKLKAMGANPDEVEGFKVMDEEDVKKLSLGLVLDAGDFVPHLHSKTWILFKTTKSHPFYIGDNPVTLQNFQDTGPYGSLGLAVKGIEIYFPISKTLSLGIYCKSHEEKIRDTYNKLQILKDAKVDMSKSPEIDQDWVTNLMDGIEEGKPVQTQLENVINLNSLQVSFASRFVFSSKDDFSLVRQMIADNVNFKRGIQMQIN